MVGGMMFTATAQHPRPWVALRLAEEEVARMVGAHADLGPVHPDAVMRITDAVIVVNVVRNGDGDIDHFRATVTATVAVVTP